MKNVFFLQLALCLFVASITYGQWATNAEDIYNTNNGKVAVGINSPATLFHVAKGTTEPTIRIQNLGGFGGATFEMIDDASGANWKFKATLTGGFKIRDHSFGHDVIVIEPNSFPNAIYISNLGNIGIGTPTPDSSAILDLNSTSKGFLPPRLTLTEINAIQDPADGLIVFCTNCGSDGNGALSMFMAGTWFKLNVDCLNPASPTQGTHVPSATQIIWNWNTVDGATGYKWNITNNYNTATDLGNITTYNESGLGCNTEYTRYIWAYSSTCNSDPSSLVSTTSACGGTCPDIPSVTYSGQTYNTVQIGTQCWLRESLNVGVQINGTANQTDDGIIQKYCYADVSANCEIYGGLYQWNETMAYLTTPGSQGICPSGWHVPTDAEWCTLSTFLDATVNCSSIGGSGTNAGYEMKSAIGWDTGGNGSNSSGFTALPSGVRYSNYYDGKGWASDMWTSTSTSPGAYYRVIGLGSEIGRYNSDLEDGHGFAVRCVKNN
jgi:uncharacterized protein (TIGR02145 family)